MNHTATVSAGVPSTEALGRAPGDRRPFPSWLIFGFLTMLNLVAMYGQSAWFRIAITNHNGPEDWIIPVFVALVIELIGVYLSGMAHAALMADQSAGLLRSGSYAIGALVGGLNYWHFAGKNFQPTPAAITFGALSAISPWLWAIYSRYMNRDRLSELGLIDKRGVKLSINRKIWHPVKSLKVMSFASWEGITEPEEAVRRWELQRQLPEAPVSPAPFTPEPERTTRTPSEWVALAETAKSANPGLTWEQAAREIGCSDRYLRECRKQVTS